MKLAVVYKNHTLGLLGEAFGKQAIEVLGSIGSFGGKSVNDSPVLFVESSEFRPATIDDFGVFSVDYNDAYSVSDEKDQDGLTLFDGIEEIQSQAKGSLEMVIQRENSRVIRYFNCEGVAMSNLYRQATQNKKVVQFIHH